MNSLLNEAIYSQFWFPIETDQHSQPTFVVQTETSRKYFINIQRFSNHQQIIVGVSFIFFYFLFFFAIVQPVCFRSVVDNSNEARRIKIQQHLKFISLIYKCHSNMQNECEQNNFNKKRTSTFSMQHPHKRYYQRKKFVLLSYFLLYLSHRCGVVCQFCQSQPKMIV